MKKYAIILAAIILMTSCVTNKDYYEILDAKDVFLTYTAENVKAFAVDDNGIVFSYEADLKELNKKIINTYDLNGLKTASYEFDFYGDISKIAVGENVIYFTGFSYTDYNSFTLYSYDIETDDLRELVFLNKFNWIKKIAYLDGMVYLMGIDPDCLNKGYSLGPNDMQDYITYSYDGTVMAAYSIAEDNFEVIFDELPYSFSPAPDNKFILYAYDSDGGNYFAEFDPKSRELGEKFYTEIRTVLNFAVDNNKGIFTSGASKTASFNALSYFPLTNVSCLTDIMPNVSINDIIYRKGFTFYLNFIGDTGNGRVERIKNSVYIRNNQKIKMISPGFYITDIFSSGYNIEMNQLNYEEFALTALSNDKKYDVCYINSRQDFSQNIKNKGSFYPLNDVPNVKEFIDSCFPYIKEAATNNNGDIWMLPIDVSIPVIIYNDINSKKEGFDFTSVKDIYDIINIFDKAREKSENLYHFNGFAVLRKSISMYLRNNTSVDTPEFRKLAPALKDFASNRLSAGDSFSISDYCIKNRNEGFLFVSDESRVTQNLPFIVSRTDLNASSLTGTDDVNSAFCIFLCVNPNSDNLKSTLEYISALCEYMLAEKDLFMFTDVSKYSNSEYVLELYRLYENSTIDFNVSDQIFEDDFNKYLNDELTLEKFIFEADRKLTMYYNE